MLAAAGRLSVTELRFFALLAGILVYGAAGVPTPDAVGVVEIAVAGLFLYAAGGVRLSRVLLPARVGTARGAWRAAARLLLLYGLTVPVVTGIAAGHGVALVLRDVLPFLFLLLPLFFTGLLAACPGRAGLLIPAVVAAGLFFALRVVVPAALSAQGVLTSVADPWRLGNAPTVLFAALLLLGTAGTALYRQAGVRAGLTVAACGLAALPPLVAMALITQRASIGYVVFALAVLALTGVVRRPARAALPCLLLLAAAALGWPAISAVNDAMMQKTAMVGGNMRWQEMIAVLDRLGGAPLATLFGQGWGATFASPAVGGHVVNYTHNLLTTYLLKTGLCGVVLVSVYLGGLAALLCRAVFISPVMGLALAGPFLIDIFLYASFKSLDFGLVLLLIPLGVTAAHKLHKTPSYSIQNPLPEPETEKAGPA